MKVQKKFVVCTMIPCIFAFCFPGLSSFGSGLMIQFSQCRQSDHDAFSVAPNDCFVALLIDKAAN
jgi:hypothetical protein